MASNSKIKRNRGRWGRPNRAQRYREQHQDQRHRGAAYRLRHGIGHGTPSGRTTDEQRLGARRG